MKVGDLVWVVGHPRDGLQRFLAIITATPTVNAQAKYTVVSCTYGTSYLFFRFELEEFNESG